MTIVDLTGRTPAWPEAASERWQACLDDARGTPGAWRPAPRGGHPRLRQALAAHLGVDAERLAVTSGVRSALTLALDGARRLVLERPTFLEIAMIAKARGTDVTLAPISRALAGDVPDIAGAVLWVTHPARNPDGYSLSADETAQLLKVADRYHRVVVNQAYLWCAPDTAVLGDVMHVGSLHKLTGGGMQVGWVWPVPPEYWSVPADGGPPWLWQDALATFIAGGGLDGFADELRLACRRRARFAVATGAAATGNGPYHLLTVPPGLSERRVLDAFATAGLNVSPGSAFASPGTVRLGFTNVDDDVVTSVIERTRSALAELEKEASTRGAD